MSAASLAVPGSSCEMTHEERVRAFKSDPQLMEAATRFVNEVLERAKEEALRRALQDKVSYVCYKMLNKIKTKENNYLYLITPRLQLLSIFYIPIFLLHYQISYIKERMSFLL
jgi:uncharacterized protein YktA (UPF0223 family)